MELPPYRCERARDAAQLRKAQALNDRVYGRRLGLPPSEPWVACEQTAVFIVRKGSEVVGTMTAQGLAWSPSAAARVPLEIEQAYDLSGLGVSPAQLVEIRRMAVAPHHPGAVQCLYGCATALSVACGVTHWIGLVEANGDRACDAPLVHQVLDAHGLVRYPMSVRPVTEAPLFEPVPASTRAAFRPSQVRRLLPPPRIRSFARLFQARAVGVPCVHPTYPRLVVPMLAEVAGFRERWLAATALNRRQR